MKLNRSLFLFGLIPASSAVFSLAKNEDHDTNSHSSLDTNISSIIKNEADGGALWLSDSEKNAKLEKRGRVLTHCKRNGQINVIVGIDGGDHYDQTSWTLLNKGTATVVASGGLSYESGQYWFYCLPAGDYTLTIYDSAGDGMIDDGSTNFRVYVDDMLEFNVDGYNFGSSTSRDFTVPTYFPPTAICKDVNVFADDTLKATVAASAFDNGSTDLDGDSLIFSVTPTGPYNVGTTPVTLTVFDGTISDSCSAEVTVLEPKTEPPSPCAGVNCSNAGKCQVTSPTTALCQCENSFVPSESGLGCICPDGLNFHANVNRCLPPPTAAPTNSPTKSPTLAPVASPTASPIIKTHEVPDCTDDDFGTFTLFNVKEEVECSWLIKNEKKIKVRKQNHCGRDDVKKLCPSTCGTCTECDDNEGTFTLPNMYKNVHCDWITKNNVKTETRKGTYCVLDEVRDMCKASCDACTLEDDSGRV